MPKCPECGYEGKARVEYLEMLRPLQRRIANQRKEIRRLLLVEADWNAEMLARAAAYLKRAPSQETSGGICARMPDKIEEKSCLYGGDKHCPYFKPGHPCCDCGATANR